ncbi:hypothetical protein EAO72_40835 [Streptomyces sp. or43]|nr:hypothetical protein EAO72_40835 [Streptomyces sp. or43]
MTADLAAPPTLPGWVRRSATGRLTLRLAKHIRCQDCRADLQELAEWYMVHDQVWAQASTCERGGHLCIGCLETRIGRQLAGGDFTGAPVNRSERWGRRSPRFKDRLQRTGNPR